MNVSSQYHISARTKRAPATVAVAPVTRAIRAALAVSATMLALSAPVMAGTCSHATTASYSLVCNSSFVPADAGQAPVDLTRVEGARAPVSVIAAVGDAHWAGNVSRPLSLDSEAAASFAIWDLGAVDDLALVGEGANPTLQIDNTNPIEVYSATGDATGLYAGGGDNWISNGSSIHADGYSSATGVRTWGDYVRVDNSGSVVAEAASSGSYVPVIGMRASGYDARVYNDTYGLISATSSTDATYGWARARGVYATGYFDGVTVGNDGDIRAHAQADNGRAEAHGIYAFGYGSPTTVTNAGDIEVSAVSANGGAYATGINSIGYGSGANNAEVVNTGSILAEADAAYAYAFGVLNLTRQRYGSAYLSNDGDIHAEATGNYTTATGSLNLALRYGDAVTTNTGNIEAVANGASGGSATGVFNYALVYDAVVDNSGVVDATATGDVAVAVGIYNQSVMYGYTTTVNSGSVGAHAYGETMARAAGLVGMSQLMVDINNYGDVDVTASAVDGTATAAGLYALSYQASTVRNYGDVSAHAQSVYGDAIAYGAFAYGGFSGTGLLINGGYLSAEATAGDGATAYAAGAIVMADVATIFNDVSMSATATAGTGGAAYATGARTYGLYSAINNYGDLVAGASADGGVALARGVDSYGYFGSSVYNAGDVLASGSAAGGTASAIGAYSLGIIFGAYTTNIGTISAEARGDSATAHGALNAAVYLGDAITTNAGSISATAEGGLAEYGEAEAIAFGVYNFAFLYDSVVDNSGSIFASASATAEISPEEGFLQAKAIGAMANNAYGYGATVVANSGDIGASAEVSTGYAVAWGAVAQSSGAYGGTSLIDNEGSIWSQAYADIGMATATGAYAVNLLGASQIVNHGDIVASARGEGGNSNYLTFAVVYGARASSVYGDAAVANYGNIESHASVLGGIAYSYGVVASSGGYASVNNAAGANITATVEAELFGGAFANAVTVSGIYGVDVVNDGSITAYSHANAYDNGDFHGYGATGSTGIAVSGLMGDTTVVNHGDVAAIAIAEHSLSVLQGGAGAVGIDSYSGKYADIVNAGSVTAIAQAEFGWAGATGVSVRSAKYGESITNEAGASIVAYASVGSLYGDQQPGSAVAFGTQMWGAGLNDAYTYNAGSIVAHAVVTPDDGATPVGGTAFAYGSATGFHSAVDGSTLVNLGDIEAAASADSGYATAYGSYVHATSVSTTSNDGAIRASAQAASGNAWAVGSFGFAQRGETYVPCEERQGPYGPYQFCDYSQSTYVVVDGHTTLDNSGDIAAIASAHGGVGYSYGAAMLGAFSASITNAGHISAVSEADDALAVGALANAFYGEATVTNSGIISAVSRGDIADAKGVHALGAYGAQVDNTGQILAGAYGADATATAVAMESSGSNVLTNTGTIAALGDGTRIAVSSSADAMATIVNSGSLIGAIVTGNLDDSFENAAGGTWNAVGVSDFGAGDNHIVNAGTIVMDDASIVLDGQTVGAIAAFAAVQPASQIGGSTFGNTGTMFVSGAYNTIDTGAFANDGVISFVDGTPDDVLTIVGDFAGSGVINLDVSGLNQTSDQLYVDGSIIQPTTQTLNVNLVAPPATPNLDIPLITTSGTLAGDFVLGNMQFAHDGFVSMDFDLNVSANSVSLGVDVTGLNATGSLAAIVAPGVQSLVNAQVGTFRQRMGVVPEMGKTGLAPWMRLFTDSGDVDARYSGNFGAGGLGFHQSNHGWEVGLDTRPSEHVTLGAFIAKSDGSQGLAGSGSNRFDGRTFGLYGTWFGGHGAYVDVSHRWTGVDVRLRSAMGEYTTKASAQSFNVEGGFTAWASANGLNVTPQLQYTRTRIGDIRTLHASQAEFVNDGSVSSRGRLGVAFDQSFQRGGFTLTPYGSLNVVREFDGDFDHAINGGLQGATRTDGTSAMVELGLGARKGKLSLAGGANWMDGGALDSVTGAQLTARYTW